MGAYFIYNGISSKDMGVILKELPPITRPKKRIEMIEVPGKNGTLHIDENSYDPITISLECTLKKDIDARSITKWLSDFGTITFSDELDKFYNAVITNSIPLERVFRLYREFIIQLELQPIALSIDEYTYECNNNEVNTFELLCSAPTYPYIKLTGTGQVQVTINSQIFSVNIDDEYIELDCELQNAYKETQSKNDKMNGEFPSLIPGENTIQVIGTATMQMKYRKAYI